MVSRKIQTANYPFNIVWFLSKSWTIFSQFSFGRTIYFIQILKYSDTRDRYRYKSLLNKFNITNIFNYSRMGIWYHDGTFLTVSMYASTTHWKSNDRFTALIPSLTSNETIGFSTFTNTRSHRYIAYCLCVHEFTSHSDVFNTSLTVVDAFYFPWSTPNEVK